MSEKTKFTTREWILSIIIMLIIEAFIFWVAFQFAGNSSALGYVSFAGTLISIILAVLAIGYTYVESQQQKNSSATFANQLDSLVKIKDKLQIQAEALENIQNLKNDITDFKAEVFDHFSETKNKIESNNGFIKQLIDGGDDEKKILNNIQDSDVNSRLFERMFTDNEMNIFKIGYVIAFAYIQSTRLNNPDEDIWKYMKNNSYLKELFNSNNSLAFSLYATSLVIFDLSTKLQLLNDSEINSKIKDRFTKYIEDLKHSNLVKDEEILKNYILSIENL
ncbi:TPA: hypothetical protein ACXI2C_003372 [Acinetobacter baumannii]|uniref:hypothetical protein n=1 Tax=Acinetobacter baumannii TaxID=470 RepID=UPI0007081F3C|nr:hypothetical protein [Acinetobacter baumannii]KQG93453.1 hypothetical protein APC57_15700 [Acinetobacter baumannii]MCZ3097450.1 hypothetical protein [Acinetobacter baumannii]PPB89881.1 hypothetical protein AbaMCR9238_13240 [Acinetobacter baumannii]PPC15095.1 hypothetical protein AbaMCR10172_14495 [Acinetobacter baumannii]QBR77348.1 hypothetical protein E4K03_09515 [Acinetobacter baumannii]